MSAVKELLERYLPHLDQEIELEEQELERLVDRVDVVRLHLAKKRAERVEILAHLKELND